MKTTTLPEQPDAKSPAGADIRFLMDGEMGTMIHCTVPPYQTNKAIVHATVSEFWYVLEGHGEIWRDNGLEGCVTTLVPGTSIDIPVGTAFQYRNVSDVDLKFICVTMPPWPGDSEATYLNGQWQPMTKPGFPETFPRIETARLILREIAQDDAGGIFKNFSDPDVAKWFFEQPLTAMDQVRQIIDAFNREFVQGKGLTWAIALKENDTCVGTCGYGEVESGARGEIGFDLAKEHWGKGLMTEALVAVIDYGFEALKLLQVEAHTYSNNARAIRLLEKLGFQLDDVTEDSHCFSISRENWDLAQP